MLKLQEELKAPTFFYPFSMLPVYKQKTDNKVAYQVGLNGINLPSGVLLKEEEVDYIAKTVRSILSA